jgi:uncharacterized membrane protein
VAQRELDVLDISVEEAMKLLISGGLLIPERLLQPAGIEVPTPPSASVAADHDT